MKDLIFCDVKNLIRNWSIHNDKYVAIKMNDNYNNPSIVLQFFYILLSNFSHHECFFLETKRQLLWIRIWISIFHIIMWNQGKVLLFPSVFHFVSIKTCTNSWFYLFTQNFTSFVSCFMFLVIDIDIV